jgi:glycogen operon protein
LNDLVSYNDKHNEANGENNGDGESHNRSWNCGVEGETDDEEVLQLREKQRRNFLATLMLSQGIPMLLGGDEMGRTQHGNNNGYCQDNEVSWFDWDLPTGNADLLKFTSELIYFRRQHPVFRRRKWFQGRAIHGSGVSDIAWLNPDGERMTDEQWQVGYAKAIGVFLNGQEITSRGAKGERIIDDDFLLFFNAHYDTIEFTLAPKFQDSTWTVVIDTKEPRFVNNGSVFTGTQAVPVTGRSLVVLTRKA